MFLPVTGVSTVTPAVLTERRIASPLALSALALMAPPVRTMGLVPLKRMPFCGVTVPPSVTVTDAPLLLQSSSVFIAAAASVMSPLRLSRTLSVPSAYVEVCSVAASRTRTEPSEPMVAKPLPEAPTTMPPRRTAAPVVPSAPTPSMAAKAP